MEFQKAIHFWTGAGGFTGPLRGHQAFLALEHKRWRDRAFKVKPGATPGALAKFRELTGFWLLMWIWFVFFSGFESL